MIGIYFMPFSTKSNHFLSCQLLSDIFGICTDIQYAASLCTKHTGSFGGHRLSQKEIGVAFCERSRANLQPAGNGSCYSTGW